MNSIFAETMYTGKSILSKAYLVFNGQKFAGMSKQQAIELVSRQNARILGIDKQLGTLAKGMWASFICWSGDPFDLANFPVAVCGEGTYSIQINSP